VTYNNVALVRDIVGVCLAISMSSINITSLDDPPTHLASIRTFPFQIPLTANPPDDSSWLTPISLPVHVHPSHNLSTWLNFARESWRQGYVVAQASISRAKLQGGPLRGATWRSSLSTDGSNLTVGLRMKSTFTLSLQPSFLNSPDSLLVPVLPSLPAPGDGPPLPSISDLDHLTQFPFHLCVVCIRNLMCLKVVRHWPVCAVSACIM
jgi:hypothetical protein